MGHKCGVNCRRKQIPQDRCYACRPKKTYPDTGPGTSKAVRPSIPTARKYDGLGVDIDHEIWVLASDGLDKKMISTRLEVPWAYVYRILENAPTHCPRCKSRLGYDHDGEPLSCITCGYEHYI